MAAGLGFKDFTTGEVLTAADVDGYLMQGVWVFASAAARDAAVTSPQEGNFAYLKDTNVTTYYTGSAWANLDTTGMTNPMTTTGDMIYSSSGSTPARLGIGSTGNVLTVAGGVPSWAAPSSGAMVLIQRSSFSNVAGTSTTFDGVFSSTYKNYRITIENLSAATAADDLQLQLRYAGPTTQTANYYGNYSRNNQGATDTTVVGQENLAQFTCAESIGTTNGNSGTIYFYGLNSSQRTVFQGTYQDTNAGFYTNFGGFNSTARDYTGFLLKSSSTNITGTIAVYGLV